MGLFTQEVHLSQGRFTVTYTAPRPIAGAEVEVQDDDHATLEIPLEPDIGALEEIDVSLHGSDVKAMKMGKAINDWFSSCFGWEVMLVYLPQGNTRQVLGNLAPNSVNGENNKKAGNANRSSWLSTITGYVPSILQGNEAKEKNEGITFADCAPYLVVTQESIDDVTGRLVEGLQADVTKFRPNIVVEGAASAYEEDYWGAISILPDPDHAMDIILTQNCIRCQSLDIDYTTGTFGKGEEGTVLKKLMRDRRVDEGKKYSPVFGRYGFLSNESNSLGPRGGTVMIGDEVRTGLV
ncbi:MAG: hypothetical protein Q9221_002367 [Calogaya cf. arnoldii]